MSLLNPVLSLGLVLFSSVTSYSQTLSLQQLVTPSTILRKDGQVVRFAVHGFVEFDSLAGLFTYVESQAQRWPGSADLDLVARRSLSRDLLRRGVESRVISMLDERPLEALVTHTRAELQQALEQVTGPTPAGYSEAFLQVQEKWSHSLNCWSASPSIPGRVLSNWYPIEEGIHFYGSTYDSTEHFWQSVKYHPDVRRRMPLRTSRRHSEREIGPHGCKRLDDDPKIYLPNAYAVEFLRHNLAPDRLRWFGDELTRQGVRPKRARPHQSAARYHCPFRFSAFEEKVLWGDLADLFHLVYIFSPPDDPVRKTLNSAALRRHLSGRT